MEKITQNIELGQILIRRYMIIGERRISNYWWAFVISFGSLGFLFTGISSYLASFISEKGLSEESENFIDSTISSLSILSTTIPETQIPFFPQGLLMSFYGSKHFH